MDQLRSSLWGVNHRHDPWPTYMNVCPICRSDDKKEPALQETCWRSQKFVQLGYEGASSVDFRDSSTVFIYCFIYQ